MNTRDKLLDKAFNSPQNLRFDEFKNILISLGWRCKGGKGSHQIWESPTGKQLNIQNMKGKAKVYQVKQFKEIYEAGD